MSKDVRSIAADIIYQVKYEGAYLNTALRKVNLDEKKDIGLLTNLVYGTIKQYEFLEALIAQQSDLKKSKRIVRVILVMSLYQKRFLDKVPDYAIINGAVEVTKEKSNQFAADFVNSFLRKNLDMLATATVSIEPADEKKALEHSVPLWLYRMIAKQYTPQKADFFFNVIKNDSTQFGRVNVLKATKEQVLEERGFEDSGQDGTVCYRRGNIADTSAYETGLVSIQNISSQQIAKILAPNRGEKVWDMCAAPGGKSCHIAELMEDMGAIYATDLYEHRTQQIIENVERLGLRSVEVKAQNALDVHALNEYDRILLDAPCSGFGVMMQKPEIKYQVTPESLDAIQALQVQLLEKAYESLRPGGTLVYSTCTINRKENEKQVQLFLNTFTDMQLEEQQLFFDEMADGYSGFYYAKMHKAEEKGQ